MRVQASIDYLPFPADGGVEVQFDGTVLDDAQVQVLEISSKLNTFLSFTTPASEPGEVSVKIAPRNCAKSCRHAVFVSFLQLDSSLPKIVPPLKAFLDKRHELWWDPMGSVDHDFNENVLPLQAGRYL